MAVDRRAAGWGFAVLALCASCRFGEFVADAGPSDGMTSDAQLVVDGATLDAASDATVFDGAPVDAMGSPDAMGIPDAAQPDAMVALPDAMAPLPDAMVAPPDAGPPDAGLPDAGPPDAGPADAGSHPMGPLGEGLSTLVGDDVADLLNGSREFARFNNPVNVVVGPDGDIFVADFDNGAIRRVTPTGETITLVRGPNFSRPFGMAFTPDGSLYVQTDRNSLGQATGALWRVDVDTGELFLERDNSGRWRAMASLSDGRLVVADSLAHVVRIYDPILKSLGHLAGEVGQAGHVDGIGTAARFHEVRDLVVTATDEVLVADSLNHAIRHITLGGVVTTVAGDGTAASVDGPALIASINRPSGLAIQPSGVLYIGEFDSGRVRRLASGELSTIAGSAPGFADSTDPLLGQIFSAEGMDYAEPNLYLSDGNRGEDGPFHRVRRIVIVPEG